MTITVSDFKNKENIYINRTKLQKLVDEYETVNRMRIWTCLLMPGISVMPQATIR